MSLVKRSRSNASHPPLPASGRAKLKLAARRTTSLSLPHLVKPSEPPRSAMSMPLVSHASENSHHSRAFA